MATTWNPSDKTANVTLSSGDLQASALPNTNGQQAVRATISHNSGKYYFETNLSVIGSNTNSTVGIADSTSSLDYPGSNTAGNNGIGVSFDASGTITPFQFFTTGGGTFSPSGTLSGAGSGDVIGIACNFNGASSTVEFFQNNTLIYTWSGTMTQAMFPMSGMGPG